MYFLFNKKSVELGTTFHVYGGVYNHILALKRYSATKIELIPSIGISHIVKAKPNLIDYYKRTIEKQKIKKNTVLHSHADEWYIKYCYNAQKKGAKWVHTYHSLFFKDAYDEYEPWMDEFNDSVINKASQANVKISVSKWLQKYLKLNYNIVTEYLPNCPDLIKCEKAERKKFLDKYKLKDFILFASSNLYVKNPLEFIELANNLKDYQFVILGDKINTYNLENIWKKTLPNNLAVIEGYFSHANVLNAMAACKVFVMPSRLESMPTAMLEAMALSKAIVATTIPGCKEVLEDGKYGYLYDLGNIEELCKKTIKAFNDDDIGKKAKIRVYEDYNWQKVAPKIDAIYKSLL